MSDIHQEFGKILGIDPKVNIKTKYEVTEESLVVAK
jgi:hypothetical protein